MIIHCSKKLAASRARTLMALRDPLKAHIKDAQTTQIRLADAIVLDDIAAHLDAPNFRDGIEDVQRVRLPGFAHNSTARRSHARGYAD